MVVFYCISLYHLPYKGSRRLNRLKKGQKINMRLHKFSKWKKWFRLFSKNIFYNVNQIAIEVVIVDFDQNVSDGSPDKVVLDRRVWIFWNRVSKWCLNNWYFEFISKINSWKIHHFVTPSWETEVVHHRLVLSICSYARQHVRQEPLDIYMVCYRGL